MTLRNSNIVRAAGAEVRSRERGRKAPRVNRRAENRGAGRSFGTVHAASEKRLVLRCNIEAKVKKSTSGGMNRSRLNVEPARCPDAVEQRSLCRGHPHLTSALQAREQRGSPRRIEVCGDLVEEKDRRFTAALGDQLGVGKNETEQEGLLLTGG